MADPQTVNILLSVPTRGSDVGTWDVPNNGDFVALDGILGGAVNIAVASTPITLTAPAGTPIPGAGPTQVQNRILRFTGVLTANVQVTIPLPGFHIIEHLATGNFVLSFRALNAGRVIGVPPGNQISIYNNGTDVAFCDLPPVGTYWDYAGSAVPTCVTACTVPPWLNCDGSTFSAGTYPFLSTVLGGNTLPDSKGRARYALNQGSGRLSAGGLNGNTIFAGGGVDTKTLVQGNLPNVNFAVTDPGHVHTTTNDGNKLVGQNEAGAAAGASFSAMIQALAGTLVSTGSQVTGITVNSGGSSTPVSIVPPAYVGGITMIRAG